MKLKILFIFSFSIVYIFASIERGYVPHKKPILLQKSIKKHKRKRKIFHKRKKYKKKKHRRKKSLYRKKSTNLKLHKKVKTPEISIPLEKNYTLGIDKILEETRNIQRNLEKAEIFKYY